MEYWTGWFDNWGGPHYVFDADGEHHTVLQREELVLCKCLWKNDSQLFQILPPSCNLCFVRVFVNEESLSEWVTLLCLGFSLEVLVNSSFIFNVCFPNHFSFYLLRKGTMGLCRKPDILRC